MAAPRRITSKTKIFQLKIQLADIRPPIWRRLVVPGEVDLGELHGIIQTAFGWTDSHLHEFEIGAARYSIPDPEWGRDEVLDESRAKLFGLVGEGGNFGYMYDFGDGWDHRVTVEKVTAPAAGMRYPSCTAGRRACPPEDVGGPWSYPDFCAAIADPEHPEHADLLEWVGGSFDPEAFRPPRRQPGAELLRRDPPGHRARLSQPGMGGSCNERPGLLRPLPRTPSPYWFGGWGGGSVLVA